MAPSCHEDILVSELEFSSVLVRVRVIPGPVLRVLVVTVIHLDADLAAHTVPVDVEHVAVGLTDGLLHQVTVAHVDLLLQPLGLPDIL